MLSLTTRADPGKRSPGRQHVRANAVCLPWNHRGFKRCSTDTQMGKHQSGELLGHETTPLSCSDSPFASRLSYFVCLGPNASQWEPTLDFLVPSLLEWHELNSPKQMQRRWPPVMKISQGDGSTDPDLRIK